MGMSDVHAVVLAAGKSRRFKTDQSKQLASICGQPMIVHVLRELSAHDVPITVVIGHQGEDIADQIHKHYGENISLAVQQQQRGTGDALAVTKNHWTADHVLVLNGDMPLISADVLHTLYTTHVTSNAAVSFCTTHVVDPTGYGRIVRDGDLVSIVEEKDCTSAQKAITHVNAGVYLMKREFVKHYLSSLSPDNASQEYYLTDLVRRASDAHLPIELIDVPHDDVRGVNTLAELWEVEHIMRSRIITSWMMRGVRFSMPHTAHVDYTVTIGAGTFIGAGVHLEGDTVIGAGCHIEPYVIIRNSRLEGNVRACAQSVIEDSVVKTGAVVGPFARLRSGVVVGEESCVGNFVELKNSYLGAKNKAKHLTYLGDTTTGERVNIGAGTITCNHDGFTKNRTVIGDDAYIGSNNTLVAPITVASAAYTAAGSTITRDVDEHDLAIARTRQHNKRGYAKQLRERKKQKKDTHHKTKRDTKQMLCE